MSMYIVKPWYTKSNKKTTTFETTSYTYRTNSNDIRLKNSYKSLDSKVSQYYTYCSITLPLIYPKDYSANETYNLHSSTGIVTVSAKSSKSSNSSYTYIENDSTFMSEYAPFSIFHNIGGQQSQSKTLSFNFGDSISWNNSSSRFYINESITSSSSPYNKARHTMVFVKYSDPSQIMMFLSHDSALSKASVLSITLSEV